MVEEIIKAIQPMVVETCVGILTIVISIVGLNVRKYLSTNKELAKAKLDNVLKNTNEVERKALKSIAEDVFKIVEEEYRKTAEPIVEEKCDMFNRLLLEKVPGLTQQQIDMLRQSIAGEFNKGKEMVLDNKTLLERNNQLEAEKAELQTKLDEALAKLDNVKNMMN